VGPGHDDLAALHEDLAVLQEIEARVLWLAVRMVDHANRGRAGDDIKVGGHQASSASMVSIMTALYFAALEPGDRVAVKPHASPVFHAIQYLIGGLDRRYLTELRAFGGLQSYPSRTKDPDRVDFSTGSVGLGAAMALFAAVADRYLAHRVPRLAERARTPRYVSVLGDAELDEGNIWEAVADPVTSGLGNVLWIVDLNRQSLDRVIPGIKAHRLERMFADNGWQVVEAKYGRRLQDAFARPGGEALRDHIDAMSNEQYQSLFALRGGALRDRFYEGAAPEVKAFCDDVSDGDLPGLVLNLGGHDLGTLLRAFDDADRETDRPTVLFAYTIKGWGLPMAGDPLNHAALLTPPQIDDLRRSVGLTPGTEWDRFPEGSAAGRRCRAVGERLRAGAAPPAAPVTVPPVSGAAVPGRSSTQETFGRLLVELSRHPELGPRLVTASPDVAVSTNLGGWLNRVGVFSPSEERDYFGDDRVLRWQPSPRGQHLELGISEMNLFLTLGALGLTAELVGETLLPVGTVYDPFVVRGLDAFVYAAYSGARFVVVGTPSGVTLSHEGGAHQSTITPSVGIELPGVAFAEPAYGRALDWVLCDALGRIGDRSGESLYLRLTTRRIDQAPFEELRRRLGDEDLRCQVLAGGYRLREPGLAGAEAAVVLAGSGAVIPEVLAAALALEGEGVAASVIDVVSADRLHRGWLAGLAAARRSARPVEHRHHLGRLVPAGERSAPIVCVHDAHPHALAWLGSVFGQPVVPLGVEGFGQSGAIDELYAEHDLVAEAILSAALSVAAAG
jgi:pyruvate dehydrogenase E1 component